MLTTLGSVLNVDGTCAARPTLQYYSGFSATSHLQESVKELQYLLNSKGSYSLVVDGYFGSGTDAAVRSWQSLNGLTVDGIVGSQTWASLCDSSPATTDTSSLNNPFSPAPRGSGSWNSIMQFVVDKLYAQYPGKFSCSTYVSGSSSSDHPGNAADCFPGASGVCVTGQDKLDGDALAEWIRTNAGPLKVQYVIWQNKIYNVDRAGEGWRSQGKSGCTYAHFDHLHISVVSP